MNIDKLGKLQNPTKAQSRVYFWEIMKMYIDGEMWKWQSFQKYIRLFNNWENFKGMTYDDMYLAGDEYKPEHWDYETDELIPLSELPIIE